jgi:hypothetical protein
LARRIRRSDPPARSLRTLRDAGNFIAKLPKPEHDHQNGRETTLSKADVSSHFGYAHGTNSTSYYD